MSVLGRGEALSGRCSSPLPPWQGALEQGRQGWALIGSIQGRVGSRAEPAKGRPGGQPCSRGRPNAQARARGLKRHTQRLPAPNHPHKWPAPSRRLASPPAARRRASSWRADPVFCDFVPYPQGACTSHHTCAHAPRSRRLLRSLTLACHNPAGNQGRAQVRPCHRRYAPLPRGEKSAPRDAFFGPPSPSFVQRVSHQRAAPAPDPRSARAWS